MKVVYLTPSGQLGGAEKALLDLIASLKAAVPGYEPHLAASADGPLIAKARELAVPVTIIPFPQSLARLGDGGAGGPAGRQIGRIKLLGRLAGTSANVVIYLRRLRRTLNALAPDLIHTNGFKMHLLGLLARPRRTPIVWHIHDYVSARPLMARLVKARARRCAAIIANSHSVAADVLKLCGAGTPVHTIYNGVDLTMYSPEGATLDLDELAGMPPAPSNVIRVGMFATMARWKGHEVFLRAVSLLPAESPVRAYIVGDALYQTDGSQYSIPELRQIARELGVADRVGFTGFLPEPAGAMRACDMIVHASTKPEPFGLVIVEGMACGRPIIVSNAGGAAELIKTDVNALAHESGDAGGLAACIEKLAMDSALRRRLGVEGRKRAVDRFDRAMLASLTLPVYEDILSSTINNSSALQPKFNQATRAEEGLSQITGSE
jgi:glycosyltransferase involved in cell wall biosynthesis